MRTRVSDVSDTLKGSSTGILIEFMYTIRAYKISGICDTEMILYQMYMVH